MTQIKQHIFRCTDEMWEQFQAKCKQENISCNQKQRELIQEFLRKNEYNISGRGKCYELVDKVFKNTGRVPRDMIFRNTTPVQYEEVIEYCKKRKYKLINSPEMEKDHAGKLGTSYYDGSRAVFGNGR